MEIVYLLIDDFYQEDIMQNFNNYYIFDNHKDTYENMVKLYEHYLTLSGDYIDNKKVEENYRKIQYNNGDSIELTITPKKINANVFYINKNAD